MTNNFALLYEILSQPTAPFREGLVRSTISRALSREGVPFFFDQVGNVVVGVQSTAEYRSRVMAKSCEPLRIFMAHMDHPGFHGVAWRSPRALAIRWYGGSPVKHLKNAPVWFADRQGWSGYIGRINQVQLTKQGRSIQSAVVKFKTKEMFEIYHQMPQVLYGGFQFRAPVWNHGKIIYTKAADDLVGCFAIVSMAIDLFKTASKRSVRKNFIGLLTRAEEVGFIGAIAHFESGYLRGAKRPVVCISLETSRTLPGAIVGRGPVVRLGDRAGVFDSSSLQVFRQLADRDLTGRFQTRIMDGGTCEATAAMAYSLPSIGISVPLGNYHNQSFEGGPDSKAKDGPAPEFVHIGDIEGMIKLCHSLLKMGLPWDDPWRSKRKTFSKSLHTFKGLLKAI